VKFHYFGDYELLEEIARGGMGVVFMARQISLNRIVALKFIHPGRLESADATRRFHIEAETVARLEHRNIVPIYEVGEHQGHHYFSMKFVGGGALSKRIPKLQGRPPNPAQAPKSETLAGSSAREPELGVQASVLVIARVARAVHYAHQRGILHRDLKPGNILLDAQEEPHVTDFGLAKFLDDSHPSAHNPQLTLSGVVLGTPSYMSPEQACGRAGQLTTASDIWSLGAILYELLTGQPPFRGDTPVEILHKVLEEEPLAPSKAGSQRRFNLDLDSICLKCLEKDPARRYASAAALADDLEHWLRHEPVLARPVRATEKLWRWCHRNPVIASLATAVVLLLVSVTLVSMIAAGRATRMRDAERRERIQAEIARTNEARLRARAQDSEKTARVETTKSVQVATFLKEMLESAGPAVARGRDTLLLRELADKTATRLATDLKASPEAEALLRGTLGKLYFDLGDFTNAVAMDQEALAIYKKLRGPEHPKVAASLHALAIRYENLGNLAKAEDFSRQALAIQMKLLGTNDPALAMSLNNLASVLKATGKLSEGEALFREALGLQRRQPDTNGVELATTLNNLGLALYEQYTLGTAPADSNKITEAEALLKEALALRRKWRGEDHPEVGTTLNNLALTLERLGKYSEAEPLHRESLALRQRLLGHDHPKVAVALNNLALVLRQQGRLAEAEPLLHEALSIQRKRLGEDHPDVAWSLSSLGQLLIAQRRPAEAEAPLREALALRRKLLGNEHPRVQITLQALADALERQRKFPDAELLRREALDSAQKRYGQESRETLDRLQLLTDALLAQQKFAEAEPFARQALTLGERFKPDAASTVQARAILGVTLAGLRRQTDAEPLLLSAYELMTSRQKPVPTEQLQRVLESLLALSKEKGDDTQAANWKQRLDELPAKRRPASP
jgi:serine/threonine-protein kinase